MSNLLDLAQETAQQILEDTSLFATPATLIDPLDTEYSVSGLYNDAATTNEAEDGTLVRGQAITITISDNTLRAAGVTGKLPVGTVRHNNDAWTIKIVLNAVETLFRVAKVWPDGTLQQRVLFLATV